jgi:hypothetical protein
MTASNAGLPVTSYATRLLAASGRLTEPSKTVFERLYIRGQQEDVVCHDLCLSSDEFAQIKSSVLRTLMIAAQ